jgi:hypothetical protein
MNVVLIQPRSPWGQHPYLPNGLLSVAARLMNAGAQVAILDENVGDRVNLLANRRRLDGADWIGIGALGSPYLPEALRVAEEIRRWHDQPLFVGGEVITRLAPDQFSRIFQTVDHCVQIREQSDLGPALHLTLPSMYETSMASAIEALSEQAKQIYFRKEWCLFTSQGCIFKCNFCAATKGVHERFRDHDAFQEEVRYLVRMVKRYAGRQPNYEVYCSTLDGCQNPVEMEDVITTVYDESRYQGVKLRLRFLATAKMLARAVRKDRRILHRWHDYGVNCIGLGVDGADDTVWKRENKPHNDEPTIAEAFGYIEEAGIRSEALMVIGFPGDDHRVILRGARACLRYAEHGIQARPYLGKAHAPGSKAWHDGGHTVEAFVNQLKLFRELDYGGLASPVTHSDRKQRLVANASFLASCFALKATKVGCPTQPLFPTESVALPWRLFGHLWNRTRPADR